MTPNPEYATVDTTILEALHIMHDGKFLHLPVVDKGGICLSTNDISINLHWILIPFFGRWERRSMCGCPADNACCYFDGNNSVFISV